MVEGVDEGCSTTTEPVGDAVSQARFRSLPGAADTSYEDIVDRCFEAWNRLTDQPWKIMSIRLRDWAHRS